MSATAILTLTAFAALLALIHVLVRVGLPARSFSVSEAFVLGHWPFFFLNGLVLAVTGGHSWTSLSIYEDAHIVQAALLTVAGLISYTFGSIYAGLSASVRPRLLVLGGGRGGAAAEDCWPLIWSVGVLLTVVGFYAGWKNFQIVGDVHFGREDRVKIFLGLSYLLVPGLVFLIFVVMSRAAGWALRIAGLLLILPGLVAVSWEWSRRAALVIAAAVLLGHHLLRHGFIRRIHIFLMAPLLLTIAIFLLVYRVTVITGSPIDAVATKGLIAYFLDKLWLEASAFSAQLYIVKNFGLDSFLGGESLLAPFMFWIPRAVFPWKPNAFFLGDIIGTEYTIGVGLYGEIAANFTVMGVVPCLWFLGYVFKRLDLYFQDSGRRALHVMLYVMFVFDVIFFVRGTFNAMVVPLLTHVAIPAIMYWSFNVLRLMMIRVSAADGRTTEGQRTWA